MTLHTPSGINKFCGPWALAAIAGLTTDEAAGVIQTIRKNTKPVEGVWNREMIAAMRELGFKVTGETELDKLMRIQYKTLPRNFGFGSTHTYQHAYRETLAAWLRRTYKLRNPNTFYLINITRHYLVVKGHRCTDNHMRKWDWLRTYPHRRTQMRTVMTVEA